jgi:tetratricopeptide (TPR) repeat protein
LHKKAMKSPLALLAFLMLSCSGMIATAQNARDFCKTGDEAILKKDFKAAAEAYSKAIDLDPESSEAFCKRGDANRGLEAWENAIVDYSMAIQLVPGYAAAYYGRGLARLSSGSRKENACADFEKAKEYGSKEAGKAIRKHCN